MIYEEGSIDFVITPINNSETIDSVYIVYPAGRVNYEAKIIVQNSLASESSITYTFITSVEQDQANYKLNGHDVDFYKSTYGEIVYNSTVETGFADELVVKIFDPCGSDCVESSEIFFHETGNSTAYVNISVQVVSSGTNPVNYNIFWSLIVIVPFYLSRRRYK